MPRKTIQQLNDYIKETGAVYDHSNVKLITRKNKVRRCRKDAFLSALPYWRSSSHQSESKLSSSLTVRKLKRKPAKKRYVDVFRM